ncbi:hypothetical protein L6164_014410 [Bauhinia variegata]|uniref:Uncharacterized protein n=1 Tax=Bauhinia variegata TaxID=167791 RepID=A0ACB9NHF4_BAUVA|nr:hypothetical protein L6164_014410 [Bauhinia variegata]
MEESLNVSQSEMVLETLEEGISSLRDISKSSVDDISRNAGGRRLLRLSLTDGHSEITAIEYSHIPSLPDNVVPGTKIRLESNVAINWGILCLNPEVLTAAIEDSDTGGPPPFEKLQVGSSLNYAKSNPRSTARKRLKKSLVVQGQDQKKLESIPVQNQAAAQKLLQKLNHPNQDDRHPRGRRQRGREKREDPVLFALEEYENKKAQTKPLANVEVPDVRHDENLARQLQNQFNLEDSRVKRSSNEAEDIRMSMFKYERDQGSSDQMGHGGRGKGRGRGRYG